MVILILNMHNDNNNEHASISNDMNTMIDIFKAITEPLCVLSQDMSEQPSTATSEAQNCLAQSCFTI